MIDSPKPSGTFEVPKPVTNGVLNSNSVGSAPPAQLNLPRNTLFFGGRVQKSNTDGPTEAEKSGQKWTPFSGSSNKLR